MTETQKLNGSPVSQAIKNLLPPQRQSRSLYVLLWIRQTLRLAESENLTGEIMTAEEAENLEALTFSEPEEMRKLYAMLVPTSGEPWGSSELLSQIHKAEKAAQKQKPQDLCLTWEEMKLLQMFKENLDNSEVVLSPSLLAPDR